MIADVLKNKLNECGTRPTDLAAFRNASISVISHFKNDGALPKLEVFEKLLTYFDFKITANNPTK